MNELADLPGMVVENLGKTRLLQHLAHGFAVF
jgi:hypothetical protein